MSILKNKLLMVRKLNQKKSEENQNRSPVEEQSTKDIRSTPNPEAFTGNAISVKKEKTISKIPVTPENIRCTKNITKNYGRAICTFACSVIAEPYLSPILKKEKADLKGFKIFLNSIKSRIAGIDSFRSVLVISKKDEETVARHKRVFREIGKIFIEYFSVNWIFSSKKLVHKRTYLDFRFKMLRRIANPELFTYIKS